MSNSKFNSNKDVQAYLEYLGSLRKDTPHDPAKAPKVPDELNPTKNPRYTIAARVEGEPELSPEVEAMFEASAKRIEQMFTDFTTEMDAL